MTHRGEIAFHPLTQLSFGHSPTVLEPRSAAKQNKTGSYFDRSSDASKWSNRRYERNRTNAENKIK